MAKIMVSLPDQMKKELDRQATDHASTRSEFIREALRDKLYAEKSMKQPYFQELSQTYEGPEARKKRLRAIAKRWRDIGNKYNITGLTEIVIRERDELAKRTS